MYHRPIMGPISIGTVIRKLQSQQLTMKKTLDQWLILITNVHGQLQTNVWLHHTMPDITVRTCIEFDEFVYVSSLRQESRVGWTRRPLTSIIHIKWRRHEFLRSMCQPEVPITCEVECDIFKPHTGNCLRIQNDSISMVNYTVTSRWNVWTFPITVIVWMLAATFVSSIHY